MVNGKGQKQSRYYVRDAQFNSCVDDNQHECNITCAEEKNDDHHSESSVYVDSQQTQEPHTAEKPYIFKICDNDFIRLASLKRQKQIHSTRECNSKCTQVTLV